MAHDNDARLMLDWSRNDSESVHSLPSRSVIGLSIDDDLTRVQGVLLQASGRAFDLICDVPATAVSPIDARLRLFRSPAGLTGRDIDSSIFADAAAAVVATLATKAAVTKAEPLAVGLHEVGYWKVDNVGNSFFSSCDTALLAELTGLTIVDDFPGRDLAQNGRGGPLESIGYWFLLADRGVLPGRRIRALVDLGPTTRMTLLPPRQRECIPSHLLAFDICPGLSLLRNLAIRIAAEPQGDSAIGRIAVQGRCIEPVLDHWLEMTSQASTTWTPDGHSADPLVEAGLVITREHGASLQDLLCTSVHFIAERIAGMIKHELPRSHPVGQVILGGHAESNGFLIREVQRRLPEIDFSTIGELGFSSNVLIPASAATLALLHIDQVVSNTTPLTGTDVPRILGRITPGSPANWQRVLTEMATQVPVKMTLRSAV